MARPHFLKDLKYIEENLFNLGYGKSKRKWFGEDAAGVAAALYNFTDAVNSTTDLAFVMRLVPDQVAGLTFPKEMITQSHAYNQFLFGSALVELYFESPAAWTSANAKFVHDVIHIIRGQNSASVKVSFTAAGTFPNVNGVDGAGSTAANTSLGILIPYGRVVAPGNMA